jgi:glycosyltransferase involved in cell wall biosynthesis
LARIAIVTGAPLCRNPRVAKEARALAGAGHEVHLVAPVWNEETHALDEAILPGTGARRWTSADLRPCAGIAGRIARARRRAGMELVARARHDNPSALGYGVARSLAIAEELAADLTIGHQEVGAWVADRLAAKGYRVGADFEDWYSEDLPPEKRRGRPVGLLRALELRLLRSAAHRTTTSHALAEALGAFAQAPPPRVVYNAFPLAERAGVAPPSGRPPGGPLRLLWFSQTLGPGRGLETLVEALRLVEAPLSLELVGASTEAYRASLLALAGEAAPRLAFHPPVPPGELVRHIAHAEVSLALETDTLANKDLTVSNKILHSLLAGCAVIATPTAGQREIAKATPDSVLLLGGMGPEPLAEAIAQLAADPAALLHARQAAWEAAARRFCWERQEPVLLDSVAEALRA